MRALNYFVPIDFTQTSYNALHHAIKMAKGSCGMISLFHVIDIDNLPQATSNYELRFMLDKAQAQAKSKLKSLTEFINLDSVEVVVDLVVGNIEDSLIKEIKKLKPDFVVIGRSSYKIQKGSFADYISQNFGIPILIIPNKSRVAFDHAT